jgi:signal transduction histidine kinase
MLVHDLSNPLFCISGYSDLLKKVIDGKFGSTYCDNISDSANVMIELINNMLNIYKFEANKMIVQKETIVLRDLLKDIVRLMAPLLLKKNLTITESVSVDSPVQADKIKLGRVANNLLSNAIKFSPKNGIIYISISPVTLYGRLFQELSVVDCGPGIDAAKQDFLFNPYTQLEDKTGALPKGTGLGLAVSKLIVEAHGGEIGYRKGVHGGSDFFFRLPEC